MTIERVARSMTDARGPHGWRGPSGPAFTARVMAPIEGRPSPGFTARVMARLDEPQVAPTFRPAVAAAFGLAAVVLALGTFVLTQSDARMPAAPDAPRLATNGGPRAPEMPSDMSPTPTTAAVPPRRTTATRAALAEPVLEPAPIYQIAALDAPERIALRAIGPASFTIPALEAPAPLHVPDLPGNSGGSRQEFKEKP